MKFLILAALAIGISASAQQSARSLIRSGKYLGGSFYGYGPSLEIVTSGNSLVLKDNENGKAQKFPLQACVDQ